jgi:hypothetical protein
MFFNFQTGTTIRFVAVDERGNEIRVPVRPFDRVGDTELYNLASGQYEIVAPDGRVIKRITLVARWSGDVTDVERVIEESVQ